MSSFTKGVAVGSIATATCVYIVGAMTDKEIKEVLDEREMFHIDLGMKRVVDNVKDKIKNMIK